MIMRKLVTDLGESNVGNTNYGISKQVQRNSAGNVIQCRMFMLEILAGIN
jgi:hypothetical protein